MVIIPAQIIPLAHGLITPVMTSQVSPTSIPYNSSATDTATISNLGNLTGVLKGTISFNVYNTTGCSAPAVFSSGSTPAFVDHNGTYTSDAFFPPRAGTYFWIASFSGDPKDSPVATTCGTPTETLTVTLGIITSVSPSTVPVGGSAKDTATISGVKTPVGPPGSIMFTVFPTPVCTGTPVFSSAATPSTVTTNGSYVSGPFFPAKSGTFYWVAHYSGDSINSAFTTACGKMSEILTVPLTGIVCIASSTDTKCPAVSPVFTGPVTAPSNLATLLRVPILINDTDTFIGFDITLKVSDVTKLKPFDADLTGTSVPSIVVLAKCIGGVKIQGSTCAPTDTPDTIHLAVLDTGNPLPVQTTGLLFTAVFIITGTTATGGITIGFQTGCTTSSVYQTTTCVTLPNGTTSASPEIVQPGGFDNSNTSTLPYVTMSSSKSDLGQFFQGTASTTDVLALASVNMFNTTIIPPTVTLSSLVTGASLKPIATLSNPNVDFSTTMSGKINSTLTVSVSLATAKGNDTVTITALYTTQDQITFTISSLEMIIVLPIKILDFSINTSPNLVTVSVINNNAPTTISVSPGYFAGQVKLGVLASTLPAGTTAIYSSTSITGATTATLTFTISTTTPLGTYMITLTSNSTLNGVIKSHPITLVLVVQAGHSVTIDSVAVSPQGTVTVGNVLTFTVQVDNKGGVSETLTVNVIANNVTVATATNVVVAANSVKPVTLTWTTTASGTFMVNANVILAAGETNTLTNSSSVGNVTVQQAAASPLSDPTTLAIIIVAIIAIAAIAGVLLLRRRRSTPATV